MLGEKDIGGACWFTQLRATQGNHRQSACALGGSEEQGWVCVGIEGREHGHDVQSKTCKERTLALPPSTATFPAWMALLMISSNPFQVHFQWPSRTSLQETNLCFSNIWWASCQKPNFLFLTAPSAGLPVWVLILTEQMILSFQNKGTFCVNTSTLPQPLVKMHFLALYCGLVWR